MAAKLRVLVDANVALDVLAKREPHYQSAAAVWALAEQGEFEAFLAAHSVTTLHYLLAKHLDYQQANLTMTKLLQVFHAAPVDQEVILKALALGWKDFEDAVQMAAALNSQVHYLVTRNPKDFKDGLVQVLQPGDLLALFSAS
ncbi:MAG: PIN domain-containing protein [Anaerolineales bacterium]|nr:PIN domain-containing protein [Anaerolineales bacterium]